MSGSPKKQKETDLGERENREKHTRRNCQIMLSPSRHSNKVERRPHSPGYNAFILLLVVLLTSISVTVPLLFFLHLLRLPPLSGSRTCVSLDPLKGRCEWAWSSARMHSFRASRDLLISAPSNLRRERESKKNRQKTKRKNPRELVKMKWMDECEV